MIRTLTITLVLFALAGCAVGPSRQQVSAQLNANFDSAKAQIEQKSQSGQITWVHAAKQVRALEKEIASRVNSSGNSSYWKFDSDDEEYHAYCIALAERLDNHQITYAQYDAARTQRFNEIQVRRQSLNAQQSIIQNTQLQPRSNSLIGQCVFNPANQAYQVCLNITAGGLCAHFGTPCN